MKKEYDFSRGKRGAVIKTPPGKTRITIRIDDDILQAFRAQVHAAGGGNYQTLINQALREHVESREETFKETLRSVVREELAKYGKNQGAIRAKRRSGPTKSRGR
jgi:Arc/MetJ family transcription regulator